MITVASINHKGGVGKTTLAVNLGHALANRGYKTCIIDLDSQANVADFLGMGTAPGLYRFLFRDMPGEFLFGSDRDNLWIIPGERDTTLAAKQRLAGESFRELRLARAIKEHLGRLDFDFVVLDSAPGVDVFHIGALVACDMFLVPVQLSRPAITGAVSVLKTAEDLPRNHNGNPVRFLGFVPNFWEQVTRESRHWLAFLHRQFPEHVWPPIPTDTKLREAVAHGETAWEYCPFSRCVVGVSVTRMVKETAHSEITQTRKIGGLRQIVKRFVEETEGIEQ